MSFARRATFALVTALLAISGVGIAASPAQAKCDTGWPTSQDR